MPFRDQDPLRFLDYFLHMGRELEHVGKDDYVDAVGGHGQGIGFGAKVGITGNLSTVIYFHDNAVRNSTLRQQVRITQSAYLHEVIAKKRAERITEQPCLGIQ